MSENPNQPSVRRILLPSGRAIDVVRFEDAPAPERVGLHICPDCDSELVQPVAWGLLTPDQWALTLHCPNCGASREGVFDQNDVAGLEERLDQAVEAILVDLQRLSKANMSDEIERFIAALQADQILPEDF